MSNLIKAAEELEYVPKETLIQMAQSGDSRFPPYLVLAEIQRRTQNEKAYSAMRPPATTTVAEEKVAEFAQSGLGGMVSPPFSPPEDLPMSPPMQMAASGGLTGYANTGRTAYQDTFSYSPSISGNVPISQQGLIRLLEERGITSEEEQGKIADILSNDLARFSQERQIQIANVLKGSDDFIAKPYRGIDSPFARMYDRRSFADEILKGVSPGPQMPEGYTPPAVASNQNGNNDNPFDIQNGNKDTPPPTTQTTTPTTDVFGTLDEIKKRMQDVEYTAPTAEKLKSDRTAETLMYLGSLIAGTTDRKEFGEGLADLTSKVIASKKADDRFLAEAKLKERGLFSSDLQLAAALETLKVKALQARNAEMKADIDLAQILAMQLNTTVNPEQRKQIEKKLNDLISPYLSSSAVNVATSDDVAKIVEKAKS